MDSRAFSKDTPLDVSSEYQQSLQELRKASLPQGRFPNKRFTPFWAAQVRGGEAAAKELADKYGFVYLGEVRMLIFFYSII